MLKAVSRLEMRNVKEEPRSVNRFVPLQSVKVETSSPGKRLNISGSDVANCPPSLRTYSSNGGAPSPLVINNAANRALPFKRLVKIEPPSSPLSLRPPTPNDETPPLGERQNCMESLHTPRAPHMRSLNDEVPPNEERSEYSEIPHTPRASRLTSVDPNAETDSPRRRPNNSDEIDNRPLPMRSLPANIQTSAQLLRFLGQSPEMGDPQTPMSPRIQHRLETLSARELYSRKYMAKRSVPPDRRQKQISSKLATTLPAVPKAAKKRSITKPMALPVQQVHDLQEKDKQGAIIPRMPFLRLVKEITAEMSVTDMKWQGNAVDMLQTAAEYYVVNLLQDANICAIHAKRTTVLPQDIQLVRYLRKEAQETPTY